MDKSRLETKVGLFVLVGLVLLAVLLIQFSKGTSLFRGTYELRMQAANVGGLKPRASVLLSGVQIGAVSDIELAPDTKSVTIVLEDPSGNHTEGQTSSEPDAKRLFAGLPILGEKYNESLKQRDKVGPHSTVDRMVAARFEVPESKLAARKRFLVRVEEVDGMVSEFADR